jgi:hypothetical protein
MAAPLPRLSLGFPSKARFLLTLENLPDPYPLVVRLPCHDTHIFDLECIQPWLMLQATCPLDRKELVKKKEKPPPAEANKDDGEEEYDDMYA